MDGTPLLVGANRQLWCVSAQFSDTLASLLLFFATISPQPLLPHWQRQRPDPLQDRREHPPRQMSLGQQEPVVPGMFHQSPARLH